VDGTLWWADSEVRAVVPLAREPEGNDLLLHLSAAQFCPGIGGDRPTHHARGITLELRHLDRLEGAALGDCLGRLTQGHVQVDGAPVIQRQLGLPCALDGPLTLHLQFANGSVLHLRARACRGLAPDPGDVFESLAC